MYANYAYSDHVIILTTGIRGGNKIVKNPTKEKIVSPLFLKFQTRSLPD